MSKARRLKCPPSKNGDVDDVGGQPGFILLSSDSSAILEEAFLQIPNDDRPETRVGSEIHFTGKFLSYFACASVNDGHNESFTLSRIFKRIAVFFRYLQHLEALLFLLSLNERDSETQKLCNPSTIGL